MKNGAETLEEQIPGEIKSLEKFPTFSYKRFGSGSWVTPKNKEKHKSEVESAFQYLQSCLSKDYDIIIADEILYAVQLELLSENSVVSLIDYLKSNKIKKDLILTGSHVPFPNIFEKADLVSEIKKIKHPYDSGILARKGLEF